MWTKDIAKDIKDRRISGIIMQHEVEPRHNKPESIARAKEMLTGILGSEWVTDDPVILIGYSRDQGPLPATYPHLVIMPETTEEVAEVYRDELARWSTRPSSPPRPAPRPAARGPPW